MMECLVLPKRLHFDGVLFESTKEASVSPDSNGIYLQKTSIKLSHGDFLHSSTSRKQNPEVAHASTVKRFGLPPEADCYKHGNDRPTRSFGISALSDSSDSEPEDIVRNGWRDADVVDFPTPNEVRFFTLQQTLCKEASLAARSGRLAELRAAMQQLDTQMAERSLRVDEELARKQLALCRADEDATAQSAAARDVALAGLKQLHEKAAALQQAQVERVQRAARAEEERRRELEAQRRAEEARQRQKEEEERQRVAAEEERKRAEQQAASAAAAAASKASVPAVNDTSTTGEVKRVTAAAAANVTITESAKSWEADIRRVFAEYEALTGPLVADESKKSERRAIEKKMTVHVQQVSATVDQVSRKCVDVYQLLQSLADPAWRLFAMTTLANKIIKQYELISLNPRAAFPLAAVIVKVSARLPELMTVMLARLHAECIFTIPKSWVLGPELSQSQYMRRLGYVATEDPAAPGGMSFESDDSFYQRLDGLMMLYAAIVQTDEPAHPHGLDHGWRWLSRCVNTLPADRATAKALACFLRVAGYSMALRYRGQFIKVLQVIKDEIIPPLAASKDGEIQAVRTRLEHYITSREYRQEPEGRAMPKVDASAYTRA